MPIDLDYGDLPIQEPSQDLFGVDGFVQSLARSLRDMKSPQGVVIALNGPWGSGKSSAINLLKHHLRDAVADEIVQIVEFNPWWFRGEEALVLAFFRELYAATKPSLGNKAKKILPKLGARLLKAGSVVAPVADAAGASGAGAIASGAMGWLGGMIADEESVDKLHSDLAVALGGQKKRFVILVDDIDRLAPDEALAMFRLVKSVGRLPNVIYMLAFDRLLAERVVAERFPSEGPHYLEKIVQASFELPAPLETDLRDHLINQIWGIAGSPDDKRVVHVMNQFHDILAPEIRTPRDVVRFINAFSITWPAVQGEVDLGDFIALEAYRLFRPAIYQAVRANGATVCGTAQMGNRLAESPEQLDELLLNGITDKPRFRGGLQRVFPRLESVWSNTFYGGEGWADQRRACSPEHFQTYFRMSLAPEAVSQRELQSFIDHAADPAFIVAAFRKAVSTVRKDATTRAPLLLDALTARATDIPLSDIGQFLSGLFSVADELDVEGDQPRGFSFAGPSMRIHWFMRALLMKRTTLPQRSAILMKALDGANLGWLVSVTSSAWEDYHPREGKSPEPESNCLLTERDAQRLMQTAVKRIRQSASSGDLIGHPRLLMLLFRWLDWGGDEGVAVRRWLSARMRERNSLVSMSRAFLSHSWGQAFGDLVAKRSDRAAVDGLDKLLEVDRFRRSLCRLVTKLKPDEGDGAAVVRFLTAWDITDKYGD